MATRSPTEKAPERAPRLSWASWRPRVRWLAWLALGVLLFALVLARASAAARSTGYAAHVDDRHLLGNAQEIISSGDWDPHFFKYPSLPIYLTTLSFYLGDAVGAGGGFRSEAEPFRVDFGEGWPYEPRGLYYFPRILFALLGAGTIVAGAALGGFALRRSGAEKSGGETRALLAAFVSALTLGYFPLLAQLNVTYLNVDTPAAFFTTLTLALVFAFWDSGCLWKKAVLPGILAGFATASKYNSGLILVPCVLAIVFSATSKKRQWLLALGAAFLVSFLITVPYSILNWGTFVKDVLFEMKHYREGHPGQEAEPGIAQALYYGRALGEQFGWSFVALAALGSAWLLGLDWRRGATLLAFPVLMLAHMSTNRVHFLRTVAPAFCVFAVLIAFGVFAVGNLSERAVRRYAPARKLLVPACTCFAFLAFVFLAPSGYFAALFDRDVQADTRTQLAGLLEEQEHGAEVWISDDLCLSAESWRELHAQHLGAELKRLKKVSRKVPPGALMVVPQYGRARPPAHIRANKKASRDYTKKQNARAKALNGLVSKNLNTTEFELVSEFPGNKVGVNSRKGRPAECVSSPALLVFRRLE